MISLGLLDIAAASIGSTELVGISVGAVEVWAPSGGGVAEIVRPVTISNTGGAAKTDWPVKVTLTAGTFDFADSDGTDLHFKSGSTDLAYWRESYDATAQTATVWVKVPSVGAGGSTVVDLYYGGGLADSSSGAATFGFWDGFDNPADYRGDLGQYKLGLLLGNRTEVTNPFVSAGGATDTWKSVSVREQSNALYDPDEPNPARRYKFYFTGIGAPPPNDKQIGVAFSPDGETWTEHTSNPLCIGEDPYVVKVGAVYHLFAEDIANVNMLHYTSADGVAWTADPANPVITPGGVGTWDSTSSGMSPTVVWTGTEFVCAYEGWEATNDYKTGIARSPDGTTWTKEATNPILDADVADELVQGTDGRWHLFTHQTGGSVTRFSTSDAPSAWSSTSFVASGGADSQADSLNNIENAGRATIFPKPPGVGMYQYDILGGDRWTFERFGLTSTTGAVQGATGEVINSRARLRGQVGLNVTQSQAMHSTEPALTAGWAMMMRRRLIVETAGFNRGTGFAFGSGDPVSTDATRLHYPDGYNLYGGVNSGGTLNVELHRWVGGVSTRIARYTVTGPELEDERVHEFRCSPTGQMSYWIDGVQMGSTVIDTTHSALPKAVAIYNGRISSAGYGKDMEVDWIFTRPFDGVDATASVGAPV